MKASVGLEVIQYDFQIGHSGGNSGVALEPTRLPTATEVETRQRQSCLGKLAAEHQVLVAVLGCAHAVAGDHAGRRSGQRQVQDTDHGRAVDLEAEALDLHVHASSKSWHVFDAIWYIVSSTGSRLILAISSATRETSHGPEGTPVNSPL